MYCLQQHVHRPGGAPNALPHQGYGQINDLAALQRGGAFNKFWTLIYSFFSTTHNLMAESLSKTNFRQPGDVGKLAFDFVLLYSIPSVLGTLLTDSLRSAGSDHEDKNLVENLIPSHLSYLMSTLVGVRELSGMIQGYDYNGPTSMHIFAELFKLEKQVEQGKTGE